MDRAFQRSRSLMLCGTFYSVPPKYGKIREYCYRLNQYMTIHNMVGVKPNRLKPFG